MGKLPPPNYTQIPNMLLDNMNSMEESELRVLLAAARLIIGWHKSAPEPISLSVFRKATGMSNKGVRHGVELATHRGWLILSDKKGKRGTARYELSFADYAPEEHSQIDDCIPEEHSQTADYAPEEHSTMNLRNTTKESSPKKEKEERKIHTAPDGTDAVAPSDQAFPEATDLSADTSEKPTPTSEKKEPGESDVPFLRQRETLLTAVRLMFEQDNPKVAGSWSYLTQMMQFFTGTVPKEKMHTQWYKHQLDLDFDAADILGLRFWRNAEAPDGKAYPIRAAETIHNQANFFALAKDRDKYRQWAEKKLHALLEPPKPVEPEEEYVDPAEIDDLFASLVADVNSSQSGKKVS